MARIFKLHGVLLFALLAFHAGTGAGEESHPPAIEFPFHASDRVAFVGSSSTRIGVWCSTLEFLLRTRHPELKLAFARHTAGGGTFATALRNLPKWLADSKPTLVLFNYGGNDATGGEKGLPAFASNMEGCIKAVQAAGGRALLMTPQPGDVRRPDVVNAAGREMYSEFMLAQGKSKGWTVLDTFHDLKRLQLEAEKENPAFTINRDRIHLTDCAYVAWGFYLYRALGAPQVESRAELTAGGTVSAAVNCEITGMEARDGGLVFTRTDKVLPILPPNPIPASAPLRLARLTTADAADPAQSPATSTFLASPPLPLPASATKLPPRALVPLEERSRYLLKIAGLPPGDYEIRCEDKPLGVVDAAKLAAGVNLNSVLLDSGHPAPWDAQAREWWAGRSLDGIGATKWRYTVLPKK